MSFENGCVTRTALKRRAGEFDIETIISLDLSKEYLTDIGCLTTCAALERLNLSHNDFTDIGALGSLPNLINLKVICNRITNLEGFESCNRLESIDLSGNLIGCVEDLMPLAECSNFKELRLSDQLEGWSNPLCLRPNYQDEVIRALPNLRSLDGERIRGPGSDLFQLCRNIDRAVAELKEAACINGPVREKTLPQSWFSGSSETAANADLRRKRMMLHKTCQGLQDSIEGLEEQAERNLLEAERTLAASKTSK